MLKTYNSRVLHQSLKLYKDYKCSVCGLLSIWNNKELRLQVDHINGNNSNNDLENLRFICPNCHTQTSTYAGANAKFSSYSKPTKEEFLELYKVYSIKEISLLKAVSLRVVYQWFKFYVKENKSETILIRKLTCNQVLEIKNSKISSEKLAPLYNVSGKLVRQIRKDELYKDCN